MSEITLNGISIKFPFKPYKVQEDYMLKVIECLQNGHHGVLESPTGTGKTLSLLCSSLSWLIMRKAQLQATYLSQANNNNSSQMNGLKNQLDKCGGKIMNAGWNMPKIIYASRTHSQLSQAMQELKRTDYKHCKATILGSRDQMCILPEVSREQNSSTKIHMCQAKLKKRECNYYNGIEKSKEDSRFTDEILDIEDLVKGGEKQKYCPYFMARELLHSADIIFMPYNYLLDPRLRNTNGIDLKNNVILLDEAHNVEKTCEEAASLQITSTDIAVCIEEITHIMMDVAKEMEQMQEESNFTTEGSNKAQKDFTNEDLMALKEMFLNLEKAIDAITITNKDDGETMPGEYIFELLKKAELTYNNHDMVSKKIDKIILYLLTTSTSPFSRKGNALQKFVDLLKVVFVDRLSHQKMANCYKVHIQFEKENKKVGKQDVWGKKMKPLTNEGKLINYWCFSPGFGMQQLVALGVHSVILTSGTLSPLKPLISELAIKIDVTLENPHIVGTNQICVGVLSKGPDGHVLNSSFNTRNDPRYINSLGRTVLNFSNLIPYGLLIFFPSYPIMNKCIEDWQNSGLWTKISSKKPIFVEPQSKHNLPNIMKEFYEKIQNQEFRGAIFMAVCRGKVSEGLDFANNNGRAVLIIGLPFLPLKDPRVILKKRYIDENNTRNKTGLTGQYWYQLEAMRAVNQAIGRIIRHKDDYGAIILCDSRFENSSNKNQLSSWIRPHIQNFTDFGIVTKELRNFFGFIKKLYPESETERSVNKSISTVGPKAIDFSSKKLERRILPHSETTEFTTDSDASALQMYLKCTNNNKSSPQKKENVKSINLIDAIKIQSKPLFNFNSCVPREKESCEREKSADEIMHVRKKVKLTKVPFNLDIAIPSTSKIDESETKINSSAAQATEKKEIGLNYINEVKMKLTAEKFKVFRKMVVDYTKTKNYDNLIKTLDILLANNVDAVHLYMGFKNYIQKDHKVMFNDHINEVSRAN